MKYVQKTSERTNREIRPCEDICEIASSRKCNGMELQRRDKEMTESEKKTRKKKTRTKKGKRIMQTKKRKKGVGKIRGKI